MKIIGLAWMVLGSLSVLSAIRVGMHCYEQWDEPKKQGIPSFQQPVSRILTNIPFQSSERQRELMKMLNGMSLLPSNKYVVISPASPEETAKVCAEMQFTLPVQVLCEQRLVRLEVSDYVKGHLVIHSWTRQGLEYLELGLVLAECGQDFCVPLDRDVKLAPSVEGKDHRSGVTK